MKNSEKCEENLGGKIQETVKYYSPSYFGEMNVITISKQRLLTPIVRSRMSRKIQYGIHLVRLHMYICIHIYVYIYI